MNKGLFYHLILSAIIIASWKFVIWDGDITKVLRLKLVGILFSMNALIAPFNIMQDFYNEKIKLW